MGGFSMGGVGSGRLGGVLLVSLVVLGLPLAQAGAEVRYNDWELWSASANAVRPAKRGKSGPFRINMAAGAVMAPDYLGSDTFSARGLPLVDVNYAGTLFLSTQQGIGWNMWRKRTLRGGARLTFDFGRSAADSPTLSGLPDIKLGTELGLFIESFVAAWRFKGDVRKEIGGGHGGILVNGEAAWGNRWSKNASIILGVRGTFMDDTYAGSYFSVAADKARAGRASYAATAGFRDFNGYVQLIYDFTQAFYLATEIRGTLLMQQAADSPLSENDGFFTGSVMAGYRF